MKSLNIICDENIPYTKEAFSSFGNLTLLPGREITNNHLLSADILIVRSVTNVNEELLKNSKIQFVGTTTIGDDHLDKSYLLNKGIKFASAPGCNSYAVSEWVITSLLNIIVKNNLYPESAAVIGYGNIGSKVAEIFEAIGLQTKIVDPLKENIFPEINFYSIDEILDCDIITFHTPLVKNGEYPTYHLMNEERILTLKEKTILINSSRGAVVDNSALDKILGTKKIFTAFDVWENEPEINISLMNKIDIATPHIAGYSFEGKVNGTKIIYDELCSFLKINNKWEPELPAVTKNKIIPNKKNNYDVLHEITNRIYNIINDDADLRKNPDKFDLLRKNYKVRREFNNYLVKGNKINDDLKKILQTLRLVLV